MAHAAVAAAQGNSALSGAAGAATTAAMGEAIKNALYGNVPVSQLSEEQKQTLVALGTVAAGLAGGLTGNSVADAVAGAQAGQNEVSNNMAGMGMLQQMLAQETLNSAAMAGAGNTGNTEGAPDTGGNSTVTPIPEQNKDDLAYLALKGKEAQEAAGKLGFDRRIPAQKSPFNSYGQPVYFNGKTYITPDIDSHNVTNGWKIFDRKGERMGTYDSDLNRTKD